MIFNILSVLSFIGVIYLLIIKKWNNIIGIYLNYTKKIPTNFDLDTDLNLLKDVIKTISLELWECDIKYYKYENTDSYDILVKNKENTISIKSRLKIENDIPEISWFYITDIETGQYISYSSNLICFEFLWDYCITPYHQNIHKDEISKYNRVKNLIENKLTYIKRDRILNDILNRKPKNDN